MNKQGSICILDGMGPQAGGYLYNTLINMAMREYGAKSNDDFPEIILHSVPVPDFISNDQSRDEALKMLEKRVKETNKLDISCISIACNTAHILLPLLQKTAKVPFISMIDETVKQVSGDSIKKVGLMGTPSTIKYGLYQTALSKNDISRIIPSQGQIKILEKVIRHILKGIILTKDSENLRKIADALKSQGAQGIILGCTELPLVFPAKYSLPVYNCVEILARTLLHKYYGHNTMNY